MTRQSKRLILIVALISGALASAALLTRLKPPPERRAVTEVAPLVEVLPLATEEVTFTVSSQGTVRPRTETLLSAEVAGAIVSISPKFIAGGMFEADEELLRIDPTNYEVALEQAEALLAQRQIEFDGAERLRNQGYRAESEYASAAALLASARAELTRARRNLERTRVRLPYSGMVRSKEADLGQYVSVGTRLGVTFSTADAEVRLPLTDQDLAFLDLPDAVTMAAEGYAGGPPVRLSAEQRGKPAAWEARIVRTEGVVDDSSRVTYAVASILDPYLREAGPADARALPMGTFVAAEIQGLTVGDVIRIPRSALRGNSQVLVVDEENRLHIRDVEILRAGAVNAYLSGGVRAGERVATTVIENPINGMRVRIRAATPDTVAGGTKAIR